MGDILLYTVIGLYLCVTAQTQVAVPPSIYSVNRKVVTIRNDYPEETIFKCEAKGTPEPRYEWYHNNNLINYGGKYSKQSLGNLLLKGKADSSMEGQYFCKAINDYGTDISQTVSFRIAQMKYFQNSVPVIVQAKEGQYQFLSCNGLPNGIVPRPTSIYWRIINKTTMRDKGEWSDDFGRKTVDSQGNLHFTHVKLSDGYKNDGSYYMCGFSHPFYGGTSFGSAIELIVRPQSDGGIDKPPKKIWTSQDALPTGDTSVTGILGQEVTIKCIFSGKPNPMFKWYKIGGTLQENRYVQSADTSNQELTIKKLHFSDSGTYQCGTNGVWANISLEVEAAPYWNKEMTGKIETEGDDVIIKCDVSGVPKPSVQFMINGKNISDRHHPRRELIDRDILKFKRVNKSDIQVIQCKASNRHGSTIGRSYLSIIKRTVISNHIRSDTFKELDELPYNFSCGAVSDRNTPISFTWYRNGKLLSNKTQKTEITFNSSASELTIYETKDFENIIGTYTCRASNNYSQDESKAELNYIRPPKPIIQPKERPWWTIGVVVGGILFISCIICIIVFLRRNSKISYKVDSKERKAGHDPEKELKSISFIGYIRPDAEPMKNSRLSMADSMTSVLLSETDDNNSLDEFTDIDTGKFNEDGSFIGQYGSKENDVNGVVKQNGTIPNNYVTIV